MLDIQLAHHGILVVPYRTIDAQTFAKLANAFGINWLCLVDGDQQGAQTKKSLHAHLAGASATDRIIEVPALNMEVFLCEVGLGSIYEKSIASQKRTSIKAKKGDPDYWPQVVEARSKLYSKEWCAIQAMTELTAAGVGKLPSLLRTVIEKAVALAGIT